MRQVHTTVQACPTALSATVEAKGAERAIAQERWDGRRDSSPSPEDGLPSVIFLEPSELVVLTGYKRSADQVRWLTDHGIPFTVNRLGRPVVRRDMHKAASTAPEFGPVA